ncbi:hypothetical protein LTR08_007900 [Meristemomyces frigidus]|nr:hypothetical protein LTR08_007900 [Meristemomyces frigidus]
MERLKVVALISGGKDSLFSILHCLANGHDVVAIANLYPPLGREDETVEDIDSYMYQTIGHTVIPLYEEALGLPLYRQEIVGSAMNQDKSYGLNARLSGADEDETESLIPLLRKVKAAHPEVNAVSTGAILSDYQRTRIESVALRLGLIPLSYLWQWPSLPPHTQLALLEDMAAVGQDSRLVKVASGGLDDSFLWQNVAERRTMARLTTAAQRFGSSTDGAVLGEGGEYETLAIDGPRPLWKSRIVLEDDKRQVVLGDAGSATLRLHEPHLLRKSESGEDLSALRVPPLLDTRFMEIRERLRMEHTMQSGARAERVSDPLPEEWQRFDLNRPIHEDGATILVSGCTGKGKTVAAQMQSIMDTLASTVSDSGPQGLASIAYTTIILRSMADFAAINPVYGGYFTWPIPPARVTIACAEALPDGCDVMLGVTSQLLPTSANTNQRHGLHVQSRSYWAPANIGPYSQAVAVPMYYDEDLESGDIVYVAGQIPLVPASMELVEGDAGQAGEVFANQTVLALQHLIRIGEAMKVRRWVAAIAFIADTGLDNASAHAHDVRQAWQSFHANPPEAVSETDEAEDFDIWNATHGPGHHAMGIQLKEADGPHTQSNREVPPLWIIKVDALPKDASIEWVGYGTTVYERPSVQLHHLHYLLRVFRRHIL